MNPKRRIRLHWWLAVGGLCVAGWLTGCGRQAPKPAGFALPVIAVEVQARDTTNFVEYIGETRGAQDVEIRARVAGFLETVDFTEGTVVRSNALLYTIDRRPFAAALAQAEGGLAQVEVAWQKARNDTNRLGPLWERNAISRQQFDDALAAERAAAANVQVARAAADGARIQLGYTEIRAPLEGLVGATEVKPGNLVGQGATTLLTTLSSLDPVHFRFSVSEKIYLDWRRKHGGGDEPSRRAAEGIFELMLADGTVHSHRGSVVFADRQVDPATGTLRMEVAFPNPDRIVRPGQFARVRFPIEVIPNAVVVPQRAVTELQATYSVFVVGADNKAEFRKITPGPRVGACYVVSDGIKAGEKIVVEGIQKLQNGVPMMVTLTNLAAQATTR